MFSFDRLSALCDTKWHCCEMNQFFMLLVNFFVKTGNLFIKTVKSSCCFSNLSLKMVRISLSVVSRQAWVIKDEGDSGMVVASVEIVSFSVEPDHVLVEGDIVRNKYFGGPRSCDASYNGSHHGRGVQQHAGSPYPWACKPDWKGKYYTRRLWRCRKVPPG